MKRKTAAKGFAAPNGHEEEEDVTVLMPVQDSDIGFVLDVLADLRDLRCREDYDRALRKGYEYYRRHFLRADGLPTYYPRRSWPVDIHVVAQSILTLARNADREPDAAPRAMRVALWAIDHMQDRRGFFYYQTGRWTTNRIPYFRWGQAWMLRSLTALGALGQTLGGKEAGSTPAVMLA